ncbi:hypothetical protein Q1695_000323 [Nippostrongylus brasiliensis]|nr:hypothetical protein Q1695_000323 [Nippostrongylus brasiliensis]
MDIKDDMNKHRGLGELMGPVISPVGPSVQFGVEETWPGVGGKWSGGGGGVRAAVTAGIISQRARKQRTSLTAARCTPHAHHLTL